jgi:hypothetical protein
MTQPAFPESPNVSWPPAPPNKNNITSVTNDPMNYLKVMSTTVLGANVTFTWPSVNRFATAPRGDVVNLPIEAWAVVKSDQAGTLYLQESEDQITWTNTMTQAVTANKTFSPAPDTFTKQYYQWQYVNGPVAQTTFTLLVG